MHPSRHLFQSRIAHSRHGSLRASTESSPLADIHTDRPPSEQALALIPGKDLSATSDALIPSPEPVEEEFEEISYDELRLSLCPADPAHFAPVFGESSQPFCHETIMTGTDLQTTSGLTDGRYSRALAHHLRD